MTVRVALLRGINVGGHRKLPMKELRDLCSELGWENVATYIQSGNVVFESPGRDSRTASLALEIALEQAIQDRFGYEVPVVIRSARAIKKAVTEHPEAESGDPGKAGVIFFKTPISKEALAGIDAAKFAPDTFVAATSEIMVYCPKGFASTKLTHAFFERKLGVSGTNRNLKTLRKLQELSAR